MYKSVLLAVLLLTLGACSADLSQPTSGGVVSLQGSASGLVVNCLRHSHASAAGT